MTLLDRVLPHTHKPSTAASDRRSPAPLGGRYVTVSTPATGHEQTEGTYVTTGRAVPATRGSYVSTSSAARPSGGYYTYSA
ncbi:hypothetical protein FDK12_05655 [Arthrobacter sp. NamB2]|uniref:hypothetical protein n=1 Tax=Arthrobacter sp. NamB2 TaxID=2576035 RepID=UPI0010C942E9|nr:hypothetical protein [Arthrobacter sp. NamB2]TKV29132.1 hypothetical protein FDK12_05655 [Arthrobacter sp. NamB2]